MLEGYRVLDLTDERGLLCGQILADLGADVIHVEPPGGSTARTRGPFARDRHDPESSLLWWAYAGGQRSLVLDLDEPGDQARLRDLARSAHFLIESDLPGVQARRRLSYDDLAAIQPGLVYVSITPFGQSGPKALWADSDLVLAAAAGPLRLNGDADRAPLRVAVPQTYLHAGAEGALGALLAHHERVRSGRGQQVDVSVQAAFTVATQSVLLAARNGSLGSERASGGLRIGPLFIRFGYPAKDGHVSITHAFGGTFGPATRRLMECVHDFGFCDAATRDKNWNDYVMLLLGGQESVEEFERVKSTVAAFTASRTRAELQQLAVERHLLVAPIASIADVLASEQLRARAFWQSVPCEALGREVLHPGPFARFSDATLSPRRPAPRIGEHGDEILRELESGAAAPGVTSAPGESSRSARPHSAAREPSVERGAGRETGESRPLAGVKILDLMWAVAGPQATRVLADAGAEVVRIESTRHPDACRTILPFLNGDFGSPVGFYNYNAGKRAITLDLATEGGRAVLHDLVRWADVVCESFTPHVMRKLGFDYESLRRIRPDVIMLSTCLMGQSGPLSDFAGYGNLAAAVTGFTGLAGWPDRPPVGPYGAYTDYIAWRYNAISILAALEQRRRTGRGQHIDLSQAEASLHFLAPAILDYTVNGRVERPDGHRDPEMAPHGVFPAAGEDQWVAIAVRSDAEWLALCDVMGRVDLAAEPRFRGRAGRLAADDELATAVSAWTSGRTAAEAEQALQERGVAASAVQDSVAVGADPQLVGRGHFVTLTHPQHGQAVIESSRLLLSRTPTRVSGAVPELGADNADVLARILGYDDERVTELVVQGALG